MSVKNKIKDRDQHGRIKRKYTGPESAYWLNQTPGWWVKLYMTRPKRRVNKKLCAAIVQGHDYDDMAFPCGNCRPHEYFY